MNNSIWGINAAPTPMSQHDACHVPEFSTFENSTSILSLSTVEQSSAGNSNSDGLRKKKKVEEKEKNRRRRKIEEKERTNNRTYQNQNNIRISHIAA